MSKRRFKKLRSIILAAFSAVTGVLGAASSALANTIGGPFP
jgi:zinc transporter ZupT